MVVRFSVQYHSTTSSYHQHCCLSYSRAQRHKSVILKCWIAPRIRKVASHTLFLSRSPVMRTCVYVYAEKWHWCECTSSLHSYTPQKINREKNNYRTYIKPSAWFLVDTLQCKMTFLNNRWDFIHSISGLCVSFSNWNVTVKWYTIFFMHTVSATLHNRTSVNRRNGSVSFCRCVFIWW